MVNVPVPGEGLTTILGVAEVTLTEPPPPEIVLQPNPVAEVHVRALLAPLHEGIAKAVGTAVDPVPFPKIVFAAIVGNCASVKLPEISLKAGWASDGTPEVDSPVRNWWETVAMDWTPPSVVAE